MCLGTVDGHALATITARDVILCGETRHAQSQVKTTSYNYNYNQTLHLHTVYCDVTDKLQNIFL